MALAAAFAENGKFDNTIEWQQKVIELSDEDQKEYEEETLEQYKSKAPLRVPVRYSVE